MGKKDERDNSKPAFKESAEGGTAKSVALRFVEVINAGDSEELIKLQTEDFTLIDMGGDMYCGRNGWQDYFSAYPKYKIHVQHVLMSGNGVAIIGKTTGSHVPPEVEEREIVLWTAEIHNGLVAEWRIYSDIEEAKEKAQESHQAK
jgi:hypothetical protein